MINYDNILKAYLRCLVPLNLNELNTILKKIWLLISDIFVLSIRLGRQIILPKKKTKGNLLSTLLLFFIGIMERLQDFEHGAFKMTCFFQNKYIRRGFALITCLFSFLTSYE